MKYLLSLILLTSCTHVPRYEMRCLDTKWIDRGVDEPINENDLRMFKIAVEHCATSGGENVCLLEFVRKPNYDYFALCGLKRMVEVKDDGMF